MIHDYHLNKAEGSSPRRSAYVSKGDLGALFLDPDGAVWKMISYCTEPIATFERIAPGAGKESGGPKRRWGDSRNPQVEHVVGCINHQEMGLKKLVVGADLTGEK